MFDIVAYLLAKNAGGGGGGGSGGNANYKGEVASASALPASASKGDMYLVTGEGNTLYIYNGGWKAAGLDPITDAEIDALFE